MIQLYFLLKILNCTIMDLEIKDIKESLRKIQEKIHSLQFDFRNLTNPSESLGRI